MNAGDISPDMILHIAIEAVRDDPVHYPEVLNTLPVPIYVTDAEGVIAYFNPACVPFAGRVPRAGEDRWCVTWRLYTEDWQALPHALCPMAVALRERRMVRGARAVAERPDGTLASFIPYPTPLIDEEGNLSGAINMLIDVTEPKRQASDLRAHAERCRRLAQGVGDPQTMAALRAMAQEYEEKALMALCSSTRVH